MSPDRKPGLDLSQQEQEKLRSAASWLNAELKEGACFWRPDITKAIRQFPNPIMIDFDDTLVEAGRRNNVNPQAPEALQRAERVGSVFIVTSGLTTIADLRTLGLAGDRTVVITRNNYPSFPAEVPENIQFQLRYYIAIQEAWGRNYAMSDFRLEDPTSKHLGPLFGKKRLVPLIDDSLWVTWNNPGILGLNLKGRNEDQKYQDIRAKELGIEILPDLLTAIERVEKHYAPPFERLKMIFDSLPMEGGSPSNRRGKNLYDGLSTYPYRLMLTYSQDHYFTMSIQLGDFSCLNALCGESPETDRFAMFIYTWTGRAYLPDRVHAGIRSRWKNSGLEQEFQDTLNEIVDWLEQLAQPGARFQIHPYFHRIRGY